MHPLLGAAQLWEGVVSFEPCNLPQGNAIMPSHCGAHLRTMGSADHDAPGERAGIGQSNDGANTSMQHSLRWEP